MVNIIPFISWQFLQLNKEQWLTQQQLAELQWKRFKKVLKHAYDNTTFYKLKFKEAGITPTDIKEREDLQKIPITTREDLRNSDQLISQCYNKSNLRFSITSGSSGRRTKTYFDERAWIKGKFLLKLRARLACGLRPWDRIAVFSEAKANNCFVKEFFLRQKVFSILDSPETHYPLLEKYNPSSMYGFPSAFSDIAEHNVHVRPLRIFTSSEMLDALTRKKIEVAFDAEVFDVYGCTEVKEISWECHKHCGYHINSDWLLVEFVKNRQSAALEDSSIIVSSLYNYGMPLIRYEIGDTGILLDRKCSCGRGLPLMAPTHGRSVDYFTLPSNMRVSPYKMTCAIEHINGMKQYQIVQEKKSLVIIKIVPSAPFNNKTKQKIKLALKNILPDVEILVKTVDSTDKEQSGKYRIVFSKV